MKKTLIIPVIVFAYLLTIVSAVNAQSSIPVVSRASINSAGLLPMAPIVANSRAIREFKKMFPNVDTENWYNIKEGWVASFLENDIRSEVYYTRHGDWRYTISYYAEKKLPKEIRAQIKSSYFDYTITGIEEIQIKDQIIYLVHMQDEKSWKNVRVCDGEMDVWEEFSKG